MAFFDRLFGKKEAPTVKAAFSEDQPTAVDPRMLTHIILIVDQKEPWPASIDKAQTVRQLWAQSNPEMAKALAVANLGVPTYYIEAPRIDPQTGQVDPNHLMGAHLNKLSVPEEHSVFVQLLTVGIDGKQCDITLETVFRTREPRCIVSLQPLQPAV